MVYSMTGFGRGTSSTETGEVGVEIRSVNNRYLDVTVRGGSEVEEVEGPIREALREQLDRGKVTVTISVDGGTEGVPGADVERARAYTEALKTLAAELDLPGEPDLALVASFRDVIHPRSAELDPEAAWEAVRPAFQQALDGFLAMRRKEGEALARDVEERLKAIEGALDGIMERAPERISAFAQRLKERIAELLDRVPVDEDRLAQEIAVYADRIDISEECTRLESHLDQARALMKGDEASGRSLNFLLQEMHREINTIGSKANDGEINHRVVGMKEELEKIREQVQNIE